MARRIRTKTLAAAMSLLGAASGAAAPPEVEAALDKAGANRAALQRVLDHYQGDADPLKLPAAEFLIANMVGHGYIVNAFYDRKGVEVPFDALQYPRYRDAQDAFDELEKTHGPIDYRQSRLEPDLETITAEYLIENIDLAFRAWREKPWARGVGFETFCEHILPYRCSNEPLNSFRPACLERLAGVAGTLDDPADPAAAYDSVRKMAGRWVAFSELYYLHPTDQGFDEMLQAGRGRCEDMSNMLGYAFRASAIVAASDFTPWWADRDNNHAWEVRLDGQGRGRAGLDHRAAKVYRKTFSIQAGSLGSLKAQSEDVPRWLGSRNYRDVTDQYVHAADVTVTLTVPPPEGARWAYICVFNGGQWRAIHWGRIERGAAAGEVTFTKMGPRVAYLPAYFAAGELLPAAAPFVLTEDRQVRVLDGGGESVAIALRVKPAADYELLAWEGAWTSVARVRGGEDGVAIETVPGGRLYWLLQDGSRRLERIFTIEDGTVVHW